MRQRILAGFLVLSMLGIATAALAADPGRMSPVLDRILSKKELVVGTAADMPPLDMTLKDGSIVGIEPELAQYLANALNVKLTLKTIAFPNLLPALEAGQIDMVMSSMTITPERNARFLFAGPYFGSGKSMLTNNASLARTQDSDQINNPNTTLVALRNSTSQIFVQRFIPKATLVTADSYDQAIAMLADKKAQAMVADYPICQVTVARYPEKGFLTLDRPLSYEPIGVAMPANDFLFWNTVQNLIGTLARGGQLEKIERKWFGDTSWLKDLK